ncbi:MAG TPA: hypothetical protein H9676_07980 [Firmicutes bacterium]|nr:hypothetical protein [Bacillota bacterium]
MQSKGQLAAKIIGIILVLLLVAGLIAVIYKFTNGFNEDFKTFYVEHEGKQILSENSEMTFTKGKTHRFDVKYTFDTAQTEARDYSVEIVPNAEQDFEYTVDGETYLYSKAGDLSSAFSLKKQKSYFEITLREDMTVQSVLETVHPGQQVKVPENAADVFPYVLCISSYNGNVSYRIAFDLGADVTGITLDPPGIVFTG